MMPSRCGFSISRVDGYHYHLVMIPEDVYHMMMRLGHCVNGVRLGQQRDAKPDCAKTAPRSNRALQASTARQIWFELPQPT